MLITNLEEVFHFQWVLSCFADTHGRCQVRETEDNFRMFHNSFVYIRDDSACQTDPLHKIFTVSWHFRILSNVINILISI